MNDPIKLEYTEDKAERNAIIKERSKKIIRKRIISVCFTSACLIVAVALSKKPLDFSSVKSWPLIGLFILWGIDALRLVLLLISRRNGYQRPASTSPIVLEVNSDGLKHIASKTYNFTFSQVEDIELFNKSLFIKIKKLNTSNADDKKTIPQALVIYSNAFNHNISRDDFSNILQQRIYANQTSFKENE